jgi:hypothetical protein
MSNIGTDFLKNSLFAFAENAAGIILKIAEWQI